MEKGALIGAGRTADVYAWGDGHVLKLYQDWMPAIAIEREFAITRLARESGLPVPAAEELLQVEGRLGIVFERILGISLLKILSGRPWELISIRAPPGGVSCQDARLQPGVRYRRPARPDRTGHRLGQRPVRDGEASHPGSPGQAAGWKCALPWRFPPRQPHHDGSWTGHHRLVDRTAR